jgi:hypothetical protein
LLCNVECFREESTQIRLFGQFLEQTYTMVDFVFLMSVYDTTAAIKSSRCSARVTLFVQYYRPNIVLLQSTHKSKYQAYQMAPGELERKMVFSSENPYTDKRGPNCPLSPQAAADAGPLGMVSNCTDSTAWTMRGW